MSSIELIRDFQTLGCKDDLKCAVASMVFLDLKEDSKIKNLQQLYDKELELIYFLGERETREPTVFVPTSSNTDINMNSIEEIQHKFSSQTKSITMAICDPSSTVLYYNLTNDFVDK